jgi:hypothetical protein
MHTHQPRRDGHMHERTHTHSVRALTVTYRGKSNYDDDKRRNYDA